ncbi:MAG: hypothetical protein IT308_00775, partial [Anaerolineaceae bacterium]|nr:hypothetical protein [Anaerolineaceae bacterium]
MNLLGAKANLGVLPVKLGKIRINAGLVLGVIIMAALLAFEMFNYSTTEYALRDLLGGLSFAGMKWATILAVAFCGIDFAGIARLFTPEQGVEEPKEVWYLFGAWLLAATMNAMLTWWGVSMAIVNHNVQSTAVVSAGTVTKIVPVFVSVMVWVIRILIIGSLSVAGDRVVWGQQRRVAGVNASTANAGGMRPAVGYGAAGVRPAAGSLNAAGVRSAGMVSKPLGRAGRVDPLEGRPEPTYHSLGAEVEAS